MDAGNAVYIGLVGAALICFSVWAVLTIRESYENKTHTFEVDGFKVSNRKIDRSTGLPKLPPGWTWRLRADDDDTYGSSWAVLETVDATGKVLHNERFLKSSAITTHKAFKKRLLDEADDSIRSLSIKFDSGFNFESFYGTYPPKNINKV